MDVNDGRRLTVAVDALQRVVALPVPIASGAASHKEVSLRTRNDLLGCQGSQW